MSYDKKSASRIEMKRALDQLSVYLNTTAVLSRAVSSSCQLSPPAGDHDVIEEKALDGHKNLKNA